MQPRYYLLCGIVKAGLLNIKFYYAILLEIQQLKKMRRFLELIGTAHLRCILR